MISNVNSWTEGTQPGLHGDGLMAYFTDIDREDELEFEAWYHEHLPERVGIEGFLRGRRYLLQQGSSGQQHFTLYETIDTGVFASDQYLRRLDNPTPLTRRMVGRLLHPNRAVLRALFSHGATSGRELSLIRFASERPESLAEVVEELGPEVLSNQSLYGLHLAAVDPDVTQVKSSTSEGQGAGEGVAKPECVLLVEGVRDTASAVRKVAQACDEVGRVSSEVSTYDLLITLCKGPN